MPVPAARTARVNRWAVVTMGWLATLSLATAAPSAITQLRETQERLDAAVFTRPCIYKNTFIKVPILLEVGCASNNRDNGTSFDLTPPGDD